MPFKSTLPTRRAPLSQLFQPDLEAEPTSPEALGATVSTWDFVLSQGSGNAALAIWMLANALWARNLSTEEAVSHE